MDYIVDFKPYKEMFINTEYYAAIEGKISTGESITQNEADMFLRLIVYLTRKNINPNMDNFDNKCDLAQSILGHYLKKINCKASHCTTLEAVSSNCQGHNFSVVELNVEGERKNYLLDPTYIQFFREENCNSSKYYMSPQYPGYVLLTPDAGYFIKEEDKTATEYLLKYGYIELTPEYARMYGDSFYNTRKGIDPKPMEFKSMPGDVYIKTFSQGKEPLSTTNEKLMYYGQDITPFRSQKITASKVG